MPSLFGGEIPEVARVAQKRPENADEIHRRYQLAAAAACSYSDVKHALEDGAPSSFSPSPFEIACSRGDVESVRLLKDHHRMDTDDFASIHWAIESGSVEVVQMLLESRHDPNTKNVSERTPLWIAAFEDMPQVVQYLCQAEANPNVVDSDERGPLHVAARRASLQVVKILIEARANSRKQTSLGMTPVHIAAARGEPEVWLELYRAPAVVDYGESIGDEPVSSAVRFEPRSSMVGEKLATLSTTTQVAAPVHYAVCMNHVELVRLMVQERVAVHESDSKGTTPLMVCSSLGYNEMLNVLVSIDAVRKTINERDVEGDTALHLAAVANLPETCQRLLEEDASPSLTVANKAGFTPLDAAKSLDGGNEDSDVVQVMKRCGVCGRFAEIVCFRCALQRYCSTDCQRDDWPRHKRVCQHQF
jgi:ankyrin repeat protein